MGDTGEKEDDRPAWARRVRVSVRARARARVRVRVRFRVRVRARARVRARVRVRIRLRVRVRARVGLGLGLGLEHRPRTERRIYLPYISPVSPLHLPYIATAPSAARLSAYAARSMTVGD